MALLFSLHIKGKSANVVVCGFSVTYGPPKGDNYLFHHHQVTWNGHFHL